MRIFSPYFCFAITAFWAAHGVSQDAASIWDHNGSQVSLFADGPRRQFHYQAPAADLFPLGVQPGTLLFEGRRDGNGYSGTAYVFSKFCGALPYDVEGSISADERTVTMYGNAPLVDSSCDVVGYREDELVFNFSAPAEAPANLGESTPQQTEHIAAAQPAHDDEYDRFVRHWGLCLGTEQSIDAAIRYCDSALSYPRIIMNDRNKILQRRVVLVVRKQEQLAAQKPLVFPERNVDKVSTPVENKSTRSFELMPGTIVVVIIILLAIAVIVRQRQLDLPNPRARRSDVGSQSARADASTVTSSTAEFARVCGKFTAAAIRYGLKHWDRLQFDAAPNSAGSGSSKSSSKNTSSAPASDVQDTAASDSSQERYTSHRPPSQPMSPDLTSPSSLRAKSELSQSTQPSLQSAVAQPVPATPLQLKFRRSQRSGVLGKVTFALDARIELSAEHKSLVRKYALGKTIVYDSQTRKKHAETTQAQLEMTGGGPGFTDSARNQLLGAGFTLYRLARASASAAMAALSLRITIDSLMSGVHIECKDLDELLGAEAAIVEACQTVKSYLDTAATFDGREEIVGF